MIKEYNPNNRWRPQTVKVTLMQWDYKKEFEVEVGGNCLGFEVFDSAVISVYEDLPVIAGDYAYVELINPDGNMLTCEDDEGKYDDWLKEMVVSIEIVSQSALKQERG